ncbi:NMT1-like family protein [Clostridioides difficile CD160]|nr:NMT1-like family protein [Clostridioides difficile CD160]
MKKFISILLCGVMLLGMVACSSGKEEDKSSNNAKKETKQLEKVKVSEPVRGELWGPAYLAKALGFFEEEGLDVEFVTVQSDMPTAPVLSGDAQFGLYGPEMILGFNEKNQGTKLLLSTTQKYPYSFVVAPKYSSVKDMKGKTINGADSGSSPRAFVRSVLKENGLNPDTDATYVNLPNSALVAALEKEDVAGSYVSPSARKIVLDAGNKLVEDIYNPEVHKKLIGSENYEMYITFTTDKYIKENPETVQKYVNAIYKAILWTNENSAEKIIETLKPLFPGNEMLEDSVKEIKDNNIYSKDGSFTDDGYAAINRMSMASGVIKQEIPREKAIDDTFLKDAQKNVKLDK